MEQHALLRAILGVIATTAGCSGRDLGPGDERGEGGGTGASGNDGIELSASGGGDGTGGGGAATMGGQEGDDGSTGEKLDIGDSGVDWPEPGPFDCPATVPAPPELEYPDTCPVPGPRDPEFQQVCFEADELGSCEDLDEGCALSAWECGLSSYGSAIVCGASTLDGACCYLVSGDCPVGRPFVVDGRARFACATGDASWSTATRVQPVDDKTRVALADAWTRYGLSEHASIASFARFALQLLSLGAPAHLVEQAQQAALDELGHARRSFGLASAYAGHDVGPGPLDTSGNTIADAPEIAASLAAEGCIAETVSLLLLTAARDAARDPHVVSTLSIIVEEERNHVLLAWEALAWILSRGNADVAAAAQRVFACPECHVGFGIKTSFPAEPATMRAHGYLSLADRRRIALEGLSRIVEPAADELLRPPRLAIEDSTLESV